MNNIVIFPKPKKDTPVQSFEEVAERVISSRVEMIDFMVDEFASYIFSRAYDEGYPIDNDNCEKIKILMFESIRSTLMASQGIDHFLHAIAEDLVDIDDDESDNTEDDNR